MEKRFISVLAILVISAGVSGVVQAYEFTDDFNEPHNYLTQGYYGTGWDGFIGLGPGETANAIGTNNVNHPGELYLESVGAQWQPGWDPLGPYLYREVLGDFIATVYVADFAGEEGNEVFRNDSFILARVPDLDAAGPGEDGECIHYFPTWVGNMGRDLNDNGEDEWGFTGDGFDCARYIRLVRSGNTFYFLISFDGKNWISLDTSDSDFDVDGQSIERPDMDGLLLQVGLAQCTYSGNVGYVAFDDFSLIYSVAHQYARSPSPLDEAIDVPIDADLYWIASDLVQDVNGHEVYIGTDEAAVTDANTTSHTGVDFYIVSDPCKALATLAFGTEYFWRVDEVNTAHPDIRWRGDVWSFTTDSGKARAPEPRDGSLCVSPGLEKLRWTPSPYAVSQDVYFGTNAGSLTVAASGLAGDVDECNIPAEYLPLPTATTYYWRVNTDNGNGMETGSVWSFTAGIVFYDDFNESWWPLPCSTGWDGVIGIGWIEIINGELYMESTGTYWHPPFDPLGPYLYAEVAGDFVATVRVTNYPGLFDPNHSGAVYNNRCGIMARVGDVNEPCPGEDFVSMDYFPLWDVGNIGKYCVCGEWLEICATGTGWEADRYLQLERRGSDFHFRHSPDGIHWEELECSPITRADLDGIPLQVGLYQATGTVATGFAAFDDFILVYSADLNGDGNVDFGDFSVLAAQWFEGPGEPPADIAPGGGDRIVNWQDLALLLEYWLAGVEY